MATLYWLGTADAVAKVMTATPANVEVLDIFSLLVDGEVMATFTAAAATVADVTAGLTSAWNTSTDIRAIQITATDTTTEITLTGDVAGMDFTITATAVDGGGTDDQTLTMATTIVNSGPNVWDTALNWSTGVVPVASDDVIISDNDVNICWGLDQSAVDLNSLTIKKTYTGKIGLDYTELATSADGDTTDPAKPEYRDIYLKIESDRADLGQHIGAGSPVGSQRLNIDFNVQQVTVVVHDTASSGSEVGRNAVRLLMVNSSSIVIVKLAPGGVGIASERPGEVSTVSKVSVQEIGTSSRVQIGAGTTITDYEQLGGNNSLNAAATITTLLVNGGTLTSEGSYVITTGTINAGTYISNHISGSVSFTTLNANGGTVDTQRSSEARTFTTVNLGIGVTFKSDSNLTITTLNEPTDPYSIAIS